MVRWSDADCAAALRAAAPSDPDCALLRQEYDVWRRKHEGHPSSQTIVWKAGSWAEALWAAGLISEKNPYRPQDPEIRGCEVRRVTPGERLDRSTT